MTIFRHIKSGKLYTIEWVNPPKAISNWYIATPYKQDGGKLKLNSIEEVNNTFNIERIE